MATVMADATAETFNDVQGVIRRVVQSFHKRYGGDLDDLYGQCHLIFMRAYLTYDRQHGDFKKWLSFLSFKILFERMRYTTRRNARLRPQRWNGFIEGTCGVTYAPLADLLDDLSEDAQFVAWLAISSPPDVRLALYCRPSQDAASSVRAALREVLKDMGWYNQRVTDAFNEIRSVLCS